MDFVCIEPESMTGVMGCRQRLWLQSKVLWAGATEDIVLEPEAMVYEPESMTGVRGGARVYGVRARVYGVRARVYGTLKILVSAPVPFGQIGFYWDLVGVLGLRVWGRGLTISLKTV